MTASTPLKLRIEGMDCGSCAAKIETALKGLPGVRDVSVSVGQGALALTHDADRTPRANIERRIRDLGFTPLGETEIVDAGGERGSSSSWITGRKIRLVAATAILMLVATLVGQIIPGWGQSAYAVAAVVGLAPIARRALAAARYGAPFSIETLMSIAAFGAIAIGQAGEAAAVVLLFGIGELLEGVAAGRARAGITALVDLLPRTARRLRGDAIEEVPASNLAVGDLVMVRPGDRVPSDGVVREGSSEVDEAPITGESVPVLKTPGATVHAGSINAVGELQVEITRTAADNTISRIIQMVEEAQASKAPIARLIDRVTRWYTPAAMVVCLAVIVGPPLLLGSDWWTWIYRGLAVLLIACPCALVISTPAAIASGLATGARHGLLVKGGAALETLSKVTTVAFDKTGTLTSGRPRVVNVFALDGDEDAIIAKAAAVERGSGHPFGAAIVSEAEARSLDLPRKFGGSLAIPGKAVTARLQGGFVSVGSPRHAAEQAPLDSVLFECVARLQDEGKTVVIVSVGKTAAGLIALRDEPREDAAAGLKRLRGLRIQPVMLTGDNRRSAQAVGDTLGLEVRAELLPDDKLAAIEAFKAKGAVAMVGDGINDAPALAAASVGIAMGVGTDVALETADAALLNNRVGGIADLIALSRATLNNIKQNVTLAIGLKMVFLVTSLSGETPLWAAILADTGATVLVTANALRLLRFDPAEEGSRTSAKGSQRGARTKDLPLGSERSRPQARMSVPRDATRL